MSISHASFKDNPKRVRLFARTPTDLSFVQWAKYLNSSIPNLFVAASTANNAIDLYEFTKHRTPIEKPSLTKHINQYTASDKISSLSNARNGIVTYGCQNGSYEVLKIHLTQSGGKFFPLIPSTSAGNGSVTAVDINGDNLFIGTSSGKVISHNIGNNSRILLSKNETPITALHAFSPFIFVTGHSCGNIGVRDLRGPEEVNHQGNQKCKYRMGHKINDSITSCHMQSNHLVMTGTTDGCVNFTDLRNDQQKYPCTLKVSSKPVTSIKFAEYSPNSALITCGDGYVELNNEELVSLWFNNDELDVSPWLKGNHFDKLKFAWMQDVSNPIALDNRENEIIIATNAGDLCFIVPGK